MSNNAAKLRNIANEMEELIETMTDSLDQFTSLVKKAEELSDGVFDQHEYYKAYTLAHLKIHLSSDHCYMSNDRSLEDFKDGVLEAAQELKQMEEDEENL